MVERLKLDVVCAYYGYEGTDHACEHPALGDFCTATERMQSCTGFVRALAKQPAQKRGRCRHLEAATGEVVQCPSCRGMVKLKLMKCAVHGRCTPGKQAAGIACCIGCGDYTEEN